MSEKELKAIADSSDMIVGGYSFTKKDDKVSVLNLNDPASAMILFMNGKIVETNMDPIEQALVLKHWEKNASFLEAENA